MSLSNDKSTSALQQLTFLDDLAASERRNISDVFFGESEMLSSAVNFLRAMYSRMKTNSAKS